MIILKRAYAPSGPGDGVRVLVERLWPRGLSKERAAVDLWLKDVAPSPELRRWYGHRPERWAEFRRRYRDELRDHPGEVAQLRVLARDGRLTLVYGSREEIRNSASVLKDVLEEDAAPGGVLGVSPDGRSGNNPGRSTGPPTGGGEHRE